MDTCARRLLIAYSSEILNGEPVLVSSNCLPVKAFNFEPAGHAFHSAALKILGLGEEEEEDTETDDQSVSSDDRSQAYTAYSDSYTSKGKKKSTSGSKEQDHYALLGLGHLRFLATDEQIRKSYREMALKHHPDKQGALILAEETEEAKQAKKDEIESHFKAIQEAYEVLIDPVKRRIYDSTDEFDDDIPTDCAPQDFFKVFGLAFMRNGRWSANQPIPNLGDDNTPLEEVDKFYNFWYTFKSWREFPHADEYDLEQAESRDHKRWMERQNVKLQEKARKSEYARIRTLVDNAYKKDPRILRRKEEEKAEKKKKKEAKYLARKLQEEEAARAAEEERRRKEEEEKRAAEASLNQKKLKEKEKKLLRKERTRLRSLTASIVSKNELGLSDNDVETLCMSLEMEQLKQLCDEIEKKEGDGRARLLKSAINKDNLDTKKQVNDSQPSGPKASDLKANGVAGEVKQSAPLSNYEKKERPWGKEEIEMLRKGMQKYQKGTSRRWEVISEYIGTSRSVEEILKATKTVLLQKPDSAKAFDSFLEKRKPAQAIASPLSTRVETEGLPAPGSQPASSEAASQSETNSASQKAEARDILSSNGAASGAEQDAWSETQERALIQALKAFPKDVSQRWERVAAAVPGKTVIQCKKKFALMKENFRSKKSTE
ncbi:dnaJ homolog subfamily C member 2-like [Ananas comosus]|uniref:DnaJ homolog subfamily C member 2-like n=1 Tax=Ananas comosus TaxID=4615 RepID=A0A6P5H1Z4_ANACO|nr:dnaJ homolog subfamily C member 2-like [Ananas comosus]XP_020114050.1 dnaJ homolog subfamily C member 2-like [Ananas comosus]